MKPLIFILGLATSLTTYALPDRCATVAPSSNEIQKIEEQFKLYKKIGLNLESSFDQNGELVKVYVHVISSGPSPAEGNVSDESIMKQIQIMNDAYSGLNSGQNTLFRFELAGIDRTVNEAWFQAGHGSAEEKAMKDALRKGKGNDLNLYFTYDNPKLLGWATFPWDYKIGKKKMDGVVINFQSLPGGRYGDKFSLGLTAVHETGHWLGLYHTFQDGCSGGDLVDDTPPEATATSGCPAQRQSCGPKTFDPIHNYMDYSYDSCMTEFTPGQVTRVTQNFVQYRKSKF